MFLVMTTWLFIVSPDVPGHDYLTISRLTRCSWSWLPDYLSSHQMFLVMTIWLLLVSPDVPGHDYLTISWLTRCSWPWTRLMSYSVCRPHPTKARRTNANIVPSVATIKCVTIVHVARRRADTMPYAPHKINWKINIDVGIRFVHTHQ